MYLVLVLVVVVAVTVGVEVVGGCNCSDCSGVSVVKKINGERKRRRKKDNEKLQKEAE